jgi:membrane protein DedA with SNARE-associated domain
VFATLGALIGALVNYYLALWLGRPIVYKFAESKLGRLCLLDASKIETAEKYFDKHGKSSTLIGRLVPAVRQLISIPAGLAKMNILSFCVYTLMGALVWNSVLALLGYLAQGQQDLIDRYSHELSVVILGVLALALLYFVWKKIRK